MTFSTQEALDKIDELAAAGQRAQDAGAKVMKATT